MEKGKRTAKPVPQPFFKLFPIHRLIAPLPIDQNKQELAQSTRATCSRKSATTHLWLLKDKFKLIKIK